MYKIIAISLGLVILTACGGGGPNPTKQEDTSSPQKQTSQQAQIKKPANYETVQAAFKDSLNVYNSNSRWYQDKEVLELTIIGPVYKNPIEKQSSAYKKLSTLLKKISKDKTLLDKLSNSDISKRYSKINYIPYKLGSTEDATFSAVYEQRLDSKEKLRQTLQELDGNGKDKTEQTLAIWINPQDLKNNTYTLEGYKTVKNSTKNRNSAYYHLSKQRSNGTKNQDIINAVLATLQLSIPEYVAIDRKDMLKQGETFRIITDNPDGTATGKVYKFDIETEVDKLQKQIKETTDQNKLQELDKQIEQVKASKQWREHQTKQLLYTTPVDQKMIDILNKYKYINLQSKFTSLNIEDVKQISMSLHYSVPDTFLTTVFEQYYTLHNELQINIGAVETIGKANYIRGAKAVDMQKEQDDASASASGIASAILYIPLVNLATKSALNSYQKGKLKLGNAQEKQQQGIFLATSNYNRDKEGLREVSSNNLNGIKFGIDLSISDKEERIYVAVSKDETRLFTVHQYNDDSQIGVLRNLKTMKVIKKVTNIPFIQAGIQVFQDHLMNTKIIFGPNDNIVYISTKTKIIKYNINKEQVMQSYELGAHIKGLFGTIYFRTFDIALSPNGKYLAAGVSPQGNSNYKDGKFKLWNADSGKLLKTGTLKSEWDLYTPQDTINDIRFSDTNKLIVSNVINISIIDPETLKSEIIETSLKDITDVQITGDNELSIITSYVGLAGRDTKLIIWDMKNKTIKKTIKIPDYIPHGTSNDFRQKRIFTNTSAMQGQEFNILNMNTAKHIYTLGTKGKATGHIPSYNGNYLTVYTTAESTSFFDLSFLDIAYKEY